MLQRFLLSAETQETAETLHPACTRDLDLEKNVPDERDTIVVDPVGCRRFSISRWLAKNRKESGTGLTTYEELHTVPVC